MAGGLVFRHGQALESHRQRPMIVNTGNTSTVALSSPKRPRHCRLANRTCVRVVSSHAGRNFCAVILAGVVAFGMSHSSPAAVHGTNASALPLTMDRVTGLRVWQTYLQDSARQRTADVEYLSAELRANGMLETKAPAKARQKLESFLKQPNAWFTSDAARQLADNLISFQAPSGCWSKNTDFVTRRRAPGETFGTEAGTIRRDTKGGRDAEREGLSYVGTFDNGATTTEIRFLARAIAASNTNSDSWKAACLRGLDYVFAAQFPNGGWPQVWPLQGGYHDAITFNDDAMLRIMELLRDVAAGTNGFTFVPADVRVRAEAAGKRGLDCIVNTQIKVEGQLTVWGQQHDPLTLAPVPARNYEPVASASDESAGLILFLLRLPEPDTRVMASIHAACAWFEKTRITGKKFASNGNEGRQLMDVPDAGPLWSRYYEIGTDVPIFADRDKTIHTDVNEISRERRKGYNWFCDTPKRTLQHYVRWAKKHPQPAVK